MSHLLHPYEVSILTVDGAATVSRREVWSYSAADAVAEVETELQHHLPKQRVFRVRPRFAPPHEHLREDQL